MVNLVIVGVITWFHVFSVIGWTGAALTFLISIRPTIARYTPQASGEFLLKTFPRFLRSIQVFTVLTLIFGPLLALSMADGPPNAFDLKSPWSLCVTTAASIGIVMLSVVFLVLTPTANQIIHIIRQMQQNPQQKPPENLSKLQKRLAIIPPIGVTLLLSAEVFMVAAAQF